MSVRLVATNNHPRPSILDERHEAEWLQALLNDEQAEANGIAEVFAFGFACFGGGCLVTAALFLIGRFL